MEDRFEIKYDEHGAQLHNEYIDKIAEGIKIYWEKLGIKVADPENTYGLICFNRSLLKFWEKELIKKGLLEK